jgi:hypothetical protein
MASVVILIYGLCTLTSALCAVLLLRSYFQSRYRLLFWSGLCFVGLAANNVLVLLDRTIFLTSADLSTLRLATSLVAMLLLLYGLIWEEQ